MTPLLLGLIAYVAVFAVAGPRLLRGCERRQRAAPKVGLVLWTALPTSWVVAVLAVGLAATAQLSGGLGLAALLHACLRAVIGILDVRHLENVPTAVALLGSLAIVLRLGAVAAWQVYLDRRHRRTHRREVCRPRTTVRLGGRRISIVDSPTPAAYCVPGRRTAIVLTTGALERLSTRELDAVLGHEQAHLRGRHHFYLAWGSVLAASFPFVPLLRKAPHELARLVEWLADDQAGRRHGRQSVARALVTMATSSPSQTSLPGAAQPDGALRATGSDVVDRVRRLLEPPPTDNAARWPTTAAVMAPVLAFVATVSLLLPAVTADPTPLCQGQRPPAAFMKHSTT